VNEVDRWNERDLILDFPVDEVLEGVDWSVDEGLWDLDLVLSVVSLLLNLVDEFSDETVDNGTLNWSDRFTDNFWDTWDDLFIDNTDGSGDGVDDTLFDGNSLSGQNLNVGDDFGGWDDVLVQNEVTVDSLQQVLDFNIVDLLLSID